MYGKQGWQGSCHAAAPHHECPAIFLLARRSVRKLSTRVFERLEFARRSHAIAGTLHQIHVHAKAAGSAHGAPLQFVHWRRVARHYKMLSIEANTAAAGKGIEESNIAMVAPYVLRRRDSWRAGRSAPTETRVSAGRAV